MEDNKNSKKKIIAISVISVVALIAIIGVITFRLSKPVEKEKISFVGNEVEELAMQRVEKEIKEQLRNPNSFCIYSIDKRYSIINDNGKIEFYNTQEELKNALERIENNKEYTIYYTIDCSAQNGYGGMNRNNLSAMITLYDKGKQINSSKPYIDFKK